MRNETHMGIYMQLLILVSSVRGWTCRHTRVASRRVRTFMRRQHWVCTALEDVVTTCLDDDGAVVSMARFLSNASLGVEDAARVAGTIAMHKAIAHASDVVHMLQLHQQ